MVERLGGRDEVAAEAERMEWQELTEGGSLTVGFMPGHAIKAVIGELGIPKVSAIAISSFDRPASNREDDGFYPGFYGIEGNYTNGRARIYVLDLGTCIEPLFSDLYAKDAQAA
jgi:hypothetical protein